jgi:cytochrome d ubiquinol oxidase subunit I
LVAAAASGVAAVVTIECGWIVTEVGRQPWMVYDVMHTKDAVPAAPSRSLRGAASSDRPT